MLNVTIDGIKVQVKEGSTILQAAQVAGIEIPTLCYLKDLTPEASCRICLVEIEGNPRLFTACSTPVAEGNVVFTKSEKVIAARRSVQNLCYEYGVEKTTIAAVETARKAGITLLGFSRENRFNIYSVPHRLKGCSLPVEI